MTNVRNQMFQALTGRSAADIDGSSAAKGGDLRGMLIAAFGTQKRDPTRPDTAAAAKSLGVTQRTVSRWIAKEGQQHQRPKIETFNKLKTRARQAATTKRGRERAIRQSRGTHAGPMRINITGRQGLQPGDGYVRLRTVGFDLDDPELAQAYLNAYIEQGEQGALRWLEQNADLVYGVESWHFESVDGLSVTGPYGTSK